MGVKSLVKLLTKAAPEAADKMQLSAGAKAALDASMAARPEVSAKWSTMQQKQAITAWQDALMKQTGADPVDVESAAYGMLKFKMSNNLAMEEPMTIPYLKHQKDKGDWESIMQIMKAYDNDSFFAEIKPPGDHTPGVATPDEVLKESYLQYQTSPHFAGESFEQFKQLSNDEIDYYIDAWKEGVSLSPLELKMQSSMGNAEVASAAKAIGLKYIPTWKPAPIKSIKDAVASAGINIDELMTKSAALKHYPLAAFIHTNSNLSFAESAKIVNAIGPDIIADDLKLILKSGAAKNPVSEVIDSYIATAKHHDNPTTVAKVLQANKFSVQQVKQYDDASKDEAVVDLLYGNSELSYNDAQAVVKFHGADSILDLLDTQFKAHADADFNEVVHGLTNSTPDDVFKPVGKNYLNAGAPEGWGSTDWKPDPAKTANQSTIKDIVDSFLDDNGHIKMPEDPPNPIKAKSPGFKLARKVADVVTDADGINVLDWKNVVVNFSKFLNRETKLHPSDIREIEDFFTIASAHPADIIDDAVASNFSIADMQKLLIEVAHQWKNHEISGYTTGTWRDFIGYTTEELMKMGPVTNKPIPPSLRDSWRFPTEEDYGLIIVKSPEDKAVFDAMHMVRGTFNRLAKSVTEERFHGRQLGLNDMDIAAINFYTYTGDGWQNWRLRYPEEWKKKHPEEYEYEKEQLDLIIKRTNESLDKLPDHFGVVHRSTSLYGMESERLGDFYHIGDIVTEKAYTSTSLHERNGGIEYVVLSKTGKLIRKISEYKTEEEVLFKPNTQFRVVHKEVTGQNSKGKDTLLIYLEEI